MVDDYAGYKASFAQRVSELASGRMRGASGMSNS